MRHVLNQIHDIVNNASLEVSEATGLSAKTDVYCRFYEGVATKLMAFKDITQRIKEGTRE